MYHWTAAGKIQSFGGKKGQRCGPRRNDSQDEICQFSRVPAFVAFSSWPKFGMGYMRCLVHERIFNCSTVCSPPFVWNSGWERTARTNLFRTVGSGGLGLGHLFLRQVVSRFTFIRDQRDSFLRTYMQVVLASELPSFVVSSCVRMSKVSSRFLREFSFSFNCFVKQVFSTVFEQCH